jgi:16S rRNA G966 N2-methylase RsmD
MRLSYLLACLAALASCEVPADRAEMPTGELTSAAREPDVRYEPTEPEAVDAMLRLAKVTSNDVVYDLGSGDGRIPIRAATHFRARAVGVEIQAHLVATARDNALQAGVADRAKFIEADLFEVDLRPATAVTLFLFADTPRSDSGGRKRMCAGHMRNQATLRSQSPSRAAPSCWL